MREWIITNGIGGFASSTDFGGMNTRKYHGLLVASMKPPYLRKLILSKLDESIEINGKKTNLFTNETIYNNKTNISEGYKYQEKFEKDIIPVYTYKVQKTIIEKSICMLYGKNAVAVIYRIMNQKAKTKFNLTPIINFRDFHSDSHNGKFKYNQKVSKELDKVQIDFGKGQKINIGVRDAKYTKHSNDIFNNMYYRIEKERGFTADENHAVPGTFTIELKPNEDKEIVFICSINNTKYGISLEDTTKFTGEEIIKSEAKRINNQIKQSGLLKKTPKSFEDKKIYKDLVKKYIVATDNFIVYKESNKLHTIIAGYPWFNDWSRDTLISFEGLLLLPNRIKIAEEVLLTTISKIKKGLIPNGYDEYTGKPLYNSVDASLLFFEAVNKYLQYTGNYDFVKEHLYSHMKSIINNYIDGIDIDGNNIYLDDIDYLLVSGTAKTQNTWMDAKVDGIAITPRNGKAVEINAMWYNALKIMEDINAKWNKKLGKIEYAYIAKKCKKSYEKEFYNEEKKCLKDTTQDSKIRPNQILSMSLSYPVLELNEQIAKETFITVTSKLLNKYGLKTLASEEKEYAPIYIGGPSQRDKIYHQGITWTWLLGPYYSALNNIIKSEKEILEEERKKLENSGTELIDLITRNEENKKAKKQKQLEQIKQLEMNIKTLESTKNDFKIKVADTFINEMINRGTIGSICEIYDSEGEQKGKGAFAQAWSISEVFKILFT